MATKQLPADPAEIVRHLRGDRTQAEFAGMIRVSEALVNHMETGKRRMSPVTAQKIALEFGFPKYEIAEIAAEFYGYDLGGYLRWES